MKPRHLSLVVTALALAAFAGAAMAQGFGSVSSGKRMPDAPPPPAETTQVQPVQPEQGPAVTPPATVPQDEGAAVAPEAQQGCDAPNPFMTGSAAAVAAGECPAANPFLPGPPAEGGQLATAGRTVPFGGTQEEAIAAGAPQIEQADRVLVKKSERRLYLLHTDRVIAEYPVKLGLSPRGPKQHEGDFRTPEGRYALVRRNQHSDYFLSLQVSYPNEDDLARARQLGLRAGGLIMIHGQPNTPRKPRDYYASNDWTDGCIAVSNSDMVDIWLRTTVGTPIEIRP